MRYEILNNKGAVADTVIADPGFMADHYASGSYREAPEEQPAPESSPPRYISVGSLFDRLGEEKPAILSSDDPGIKALIMDCSVRQYIDLDRPDLLAGLQFVASKGFAIDPAAIVAAEVQETERP